MTIPDWITKNSDLSVIKEGILEYCKENGTTPDALGIDIETPGPYQKVGLVKNTTKRGFEFETEIICPKCNRKINGLIVLDKHGFNVIHSEGFTIIDKPICNDCIKW